MNISKVDHILAYIVPFLRLCINFGKKMGWAAFWAIFFKTHLVTLPLIYPGANPTTSEFTTTTPAL
jgi:hypothetical protein